MNNSSKSTFEKSIKKFVDQPYKYGFITNVEKDIIDKGLNEEVIRLISKKKREPTFLLDFRLKLRRSKKIHQIVIRFDHVFPRMKLG